LSHDGSDNLTIAEKTEKERGVEREKRRRKGDKEEKW
jgi:hypothetical protein